jgi:hypothetical protein
MKNFFVVAAIFALVLAGCDNGDGDEKSASKTTLTVKNVSDFDFENVEFASVRLGKLIRGREVSKEVAAGTGYVYVSKIIGAEQGLEYGMLNFRTEAITCEEGEDYQFALSNNSVITDMDVSETGTLKSIIEKRYDELVDGPWTSIYKEGVR